MSSLVGHPSLVAILDAARGGGPEAVRAHVESCESCRRLAQIGEAPGGAAPDSEQFAKSPGDALSSGFEGTLASGSVLHDRFQIESWIASGGMGSIYRAMDRVSGQTVAIKIASYSDTIALARFDRESRLLASIRHPGLVDYVAHGTLANGTPYLAMSWLEGLDLAQRLATRTAPGFERTARQRRLSQAPPIARAELSKKDAPARERLPVSEVVTLGRRLVSVLETLHEQGVIHRDVKPANVFLVDGEVGSAKLIDLGTAREEVDLNPLTEYGTVVGTAYYMAPEQIRSEEVGPSADLWALGCVLYECLTGVIAFGASQPLAAMTRILIDEPKSVAALRADVPPKLATLIHDLFVKDPSARPTAGELAMRLSELGDVIEPSVPHAAPEEPRAAGARPVAGERWLQTFLFVRSSTPDGLPALSAVASYGGTISPLAHGTGAALITFKRSSAPKDEATHAAQLALALRDAMPDLILVVASGHDEDGDVSPVPAMLDSAIASLIAASPGQVRLDRTTASLINDRFRIEAAGGVRLLLSERPLEEIPTLLGKRSPMVGRKRELAMLLSTFTDCVDYEAARGILVTAPAGQGKSRLRHEFLLALERQSCEFTLLVGRGEPLSAGSPFVMLAPALRRFAQIREADEPEEKQRKLVECIGRSLPAEQSYETAAFLGEITGVPFSDAALPALRAARGEPSLLAEQRRAALCRFLTALCRQQPVLLVLDDLHWGDQPSIAHVDALFRELEEERFMVLALARPEVHALFPQLWDEREVEEIRLRSLPRKPATQLARHVLGAEASDAAIDALVARAEGNAFFLEELLQAAAEGEAMLPDSVIAMVQARLRALPAEARQILLAASVFGETFWAGGIAALLGESHRGETSVAGDTSDGATNRVLGVEEWLKDLTRRELILVQPDAHLANHVAYRFRHGLLRDGAYAMLLEGDRTAAHGQAASWLLDAGENDALVLAGHFQCAGQTERACHWYTLAAEQALAANDLAAAMKCADRAVEAGAQGQELGKLRSIQTAACLWSGRYDEATRFGSEAADLLEVGCNEWYRAVGSAGSAAARRNDFETKDDLFRRAELAPGHGTERVICLCRAAFSLIFEGRLADADHTIALIGEAGADADLLVRAQLADMYASRAATVADLGPARLWSDQAVDAYAGAGDTNNTLIMRVTRAWLWSRLGEHDAACAEARSILDDTLRLGLRHNMEFAKMGLGIMLVESEGAVDEAEQHLGSALAYYEEIGSVRFEGWALFSLAACALERHEFGAAEAIASKAVDCLASHPTLLGHALAVKAKALAMLGRDTEALGVALKGLRLVERFEGGLLSGELLPPLIAAELHDRLGDRAAARSIIELCRDRLLDRVSRIDDPRLKACYLARPDTVRTLDLASSWSAQGS